MPEPEAGRPLRSNDEPSLLDLVAVLARHPRAIVVAPFAAAVVVVLVCLILPSQYTAVTTFVPEVSSDQRLPAGLSGLAGQLGLSLGSGATTSPRFFADVLKSRSVSERVLRTRFAVPDARTPGDSLALLQLLEIDGKNSADSLEQGVEYLGQIVGVQVDAGTNMITLSVTTEDRELSAAVARTLMQFLDDFNTNTRQGKGREQRAFVEGRLKATASDLQNAELVLKSFYERNRSWQQSPELTFQEGQLRRRVDVQQELYLTLSREFEKARIDEVNDTPGITVIDPAVPVQQRSFPRPGLYGIMTLVVGVVCGIAFALGTEFLARLRAEDPAGYARLTSLLPRLSRTPR